MTGQPSAYSAKERFKTSDHAKGWNDLVDSDQFQAAIDAARLEFHASLGTPPDMASAACNEWRRQGARDFLFVLLNLTTTNEPTRKPSGGTLDHRA